MDNFVNNCKLSTENSGFGGMETKNLLIVFAKQPVKGQVKTRLIPCFGAPRATIFYAFSLADTVRRFSQSACYETCVCYSGERDYFSHCFPGIELIRQGVGNLGQRLQQILNKQLDVGWQRVCVVGSDSPDLPTEWIIEAFDKLNSTDVVTIPASDGGYVLLGVRVDSAPLCQNISWSSDQVLQQTQQQAQQAGYSYRQLHQWHDIDTKVDLYQLVQRSGQLAGCRSAKYAMRCLRQAASNK